VTLFRLELPPQYLIVHLKNCKAGQHKSRAEKLTNREILRSEAAAKHEKRAPVSSSQRIPHKEQIINSYQVLPAPPGKRNSKTLKLIKPPLFIILIGLQSTSQKALERKQSFFFSCV